MAGQGSPLKAEWKGSASKSFPFSFYFWCDQFRDWKKDAWDSLLCWTSATGALSGSCFRLPDSQGRSVPPWYRLEQSWVCSDLCWLSNSLRCFMPAVHTWGEECYSHAIVPFGSFPTLAAVCGSGFFLAPLHCRGTATDLILYYEQACLCRELAVSIPQYSFRNLKLLEGWPLSNFFFERQFEWLRTVSWKGPPIGWHSSEENIHRPCKKGLSPNWTLQPSHSIVT